MFKRVISERIGKSTRRCAGSINWNPRTRRQRLMDSLPIGEDDVRRIVARGSAHFTPRVRPGAAQIKPGDRRPVVGEFFQWTLPKQLGGYAIDVMNVAISQKVALRQVAGREKHIIDQRAAKIGRITLHEPDQTFRHLFFELLPGAAARLDRNPKHVSGHGKLSRRANAGSNMLGNDPETTGSSGSSP